jgi:hypothetical protein
MDCASTSEFVGLVHAGLPADGFVEIVLCASL